MQGRVLTPMGELNTGEMFDDIWAKIDSKELEEPFKGWIPQDEKYRFEFTTSSKAIHERLGKK